ncbi:PREDICTED: uncharacterized protein LOC109241389 [Nicotiana attenuata]|uniref:uncharacterized protein LOC109241389 n=1 Tax=Nicotiana attenuata TaxID=49451 RepID=UPI0009051008|nr:PREDICTED: uncharacterized protein LOC109241389 [Nicotiana attenuata]
MVALLETRMTNHLSILEDFNFTEMIEVPAEGQAGGLVILWNHARVIVNNFTRRNQEIHAMIEVKPNHKNWLFRTIYASTDKHNRDILWQNIKNIYNSYKGAWLMGGDFNDVIMAQEKLGGKAVNQKRAKSILESLNYCNLFDLGFKGCNFTWSNHRRKGKGLIMERLDRIFANTEWLDQYPEASTIHLPNIHSDHNPILISLKKKNMTYIDKPFRLETMWCSHPDFISLVKKHWVTNDLITATKSFGEDVKSWSREVLGNINRK